MRELPVCIFTRNRTAVAMATIGMLLRNLRCEGRRLRYILCDDRSEKGHVEALLDMFRKAGVEEPHVHVNTEARHGLGASMNNGLADAFDHSYECLRIEDDWLLKRPLDVSQWVNIMDKKSIGSVRLGMMFRQMHELVPYTDTLYRIKSDKGNRFTLNNQVALVTDALYELLGPYLENEPTNVVEKTMAFKFNEITNHTETTPYVCWPRGWATNRYYDKTLAFDHIGESTVKHKYKIPQCYAKLNDKDGDRRIRAAYATYAAQAVHASNGPGVIRSSSIRTNP